MFFLGLLLIFCTYKIYEISKNQEFAQKHGRLVTVPVTARVKGSAKVPNKIFVILNGKEYALRSPRKHFRRTAKLDSIQVAFDAGQDLAVFPDIEVKEPYWLLILMLLSGLCMIWIAITGRA